MQRHSIGEYLDNFLARGRESAYVQKRGYRTIRLSYRDVARTAFQFARELDARGISKGDRVLIWGSNSAEWVAAFYGCALAGVVAVPIDDISTPDFAAAVFRSVDAKLLVCSRGHSALPVESEPLVLDDLRETLTSHPDNQYESRNISPGDTLEIVFTSGTTSQPKGVVISHGNVLANIAPLETEIRKYLKYERIVHPIRFLNLLPLSHVFGQFLGIFLPQLMGGTVVFQSELNPAQVMDTIRRERVSVLVAVPRMLQSLKEKIERDISNQNNRHEFQQRFQAAKGKHFLHRWWIFHDVRRNFGWKFWAFICGGATLDSETEEFWDRVGYAVIQGYGLTETTSLISVKHPFRPGKGSIGQVLGGREVKLTSNGEILVRGGGVARAYWTGKESRPVTEEEGWYATGDIGEFDASGNLHFKGRSKDVIVTSSGMKVYPGDLEAALRSQPEIKDCVVLALPVEGNAEPCAVLILRDKHQDPAPIMQRANGSLADYQRMRRWYLWRDEDFPRTATQKPRKNVILDILIAGKPEDKPTFAPDSLFDLIAQFSGESPSNLAGVANLDRDLNLSSLDRVALQGALEERYQVDLGDAGIASASTIGDIKRMLQSQPTQRTRYHFPGWVQRWPVTWAREFAQYLLLRPAVFLLARPRIVGQENLTNLHGPAVVICNHITDVDLGFVLAALPARLGSRLAIATAGEELEGLRAPHLGLLGRIYSRIKWGLAVSLLNLFPLPRQADFRESFAYAGDSADRGFSILVFPEGGHTVDGNLRPFRTGIGLLASNLKIPVVPMRIHGLFEVKQSGRKFASPGEIWVHVGAPVIFHDDNPAEIAQALQRIMEAL